MKTPLILISLLAACTITSCGTATVPDVHGGEGTLPSWALGPFTRPSDQPVIAPDSGKVFHCPMRGEEVRWQESDTFNPAATTRNGKVCVLFRSEDRSAMGIGRRTSRIGYAESEDGLQMSIDPEPVLFPAKDGFEDLDWPGGCEDPRIAVTRDGLYVMTYTSWNRQVPRLCIATSRDLKTWQKHGYAFAEAGERYRDMHCKSGSIVTRLRRGTLTIEKFHGRYLMYWGENMVNLATSPDLIHWTPMLDPDGKLLAVIRPRDGHFDSSLTECGPPAVHTKDGIILIYNGRSRSSRAYCPGQVLLDPRDPTKVLDRLDEPFMRPELDFEKSGQYVDGTVFTEGLVRHRGCWYLYYGCADSYVGVAVSR